jgi:glutamate-1-semialdehyde 2,1-aminomutase
MLSQEYFKRCLKVAPGGVHSPVRAFQAVGGTPVFFKEAKGAYLTSVEGDKYLDFCQSFGPLILGHRDEEVQAEVMRMIGTMWTSGTCEAYSLELAEWITEHVPFVEKLRFVSSGTEAVMSALRVARAATGRDKIVKFEGCYHGHVDSLLVKAGSGLASGGAAASSAGVAKSTAEQTLVTPLADIEAYIRVLDENKGDIAAVILEPLPANFGLLEQKEEFLQAVVAEAKKRDILIIFDEVISGFRSALGGMAQRLCLTPDLVTYGKVIGGGFPVGCYGGKKEYMDLVAPVGPVYQAGTLSANPVGMVAGLTTLKKAKRENIWAKFQNRTDTFKKDFNAWSVDQGFDMRLHTYGSLFWFAEHEGPIRTVDQVPPKHGERFKYFFKSLLEQNLYLAPNGFEIGFMGNAHSPEIMKEALEKFKKATIAVNQSKI